MQGLFKTEIFTNLILSRYFSLSQLFRYKYISQTERRCLKIVNKLWYKQCKLAFFILFKQLCNLRFQKMLHTKKPLHVMKRGHYFCMNHEEYENGIATICGNCDNDICQNSSKNGLCYNCAPKSQCFVCGKGSLEGSVCICKNFVCDSKVCSKIHHSVSCLGVHCDSLKCNQQATCSEICSVESTELCVVCKEPKYCVMYCETCEDFNQDTYFCEAHKIDDEKQCPVCQHRCEVCKSNPCDVCNNVICFNSSKVCSMLKVADKQVCIKCADTFIKSTKINKKQKISP